MKEIIKLTSICGEPIYVRGGMWHNLLAIAAATNGEMKFTEVHFQGVIFRVKDTVEEVATKLGWNVESNA